MLNDKNSRYALMGCVLKDSFYSLREDIDKMCAASAMVEIINYAGTQQPQPELFELLRGCLFTLCSGTPPKALLALFIARLLKISGYLPGIEYCISCGSKAEYFIPGEGGICRKCAQKTDVYKRQVLGCTHYVFIKEDIKEAFGEDVLIFDGNHGTVKRLKSVLEEKGIKRPSDAGKGAVILNSSSDDQFSMKTYSKLFYGK